MSKIRYCEIGKSFSKKVSKISDWGNWERFFKKCLKVSKIHYCEIGKGFSKKLNIHCLKFVIGKLRKVFQKSV